MSIVNLLRVLFRRWLIVLFGLVLTAAGCYQVLQMVSTQYQASSQMVLLLPPEASGPATPSNPYLNMQSGQETVASLLAGNVMTPDVQRRLAKAGNTAEYDVAVLPGTGPIMVVTTKDTDTAKALATRDAVMDEIDLQLAQLQSRSRVPERQMIRGDRLAVSSGAEALGGSRIRALGATAAAGLLATLLVTLLADRLLNARAQRRETKQALTVGSGDPDAPEGEDEPTDAEPADRRVATKPHLKSATPSRSEDKSSRRAS